MRFIENGPVFPDELLDAHDEGQVVFFCGAGVSMAYAGLPSFNRLASNVLSVLGTDEDNLAKRLFNVSAELEKKHKLRGLLSADQIFGKLSRAFDVNDIDRAVAENLRLPKNVNLAAHKTILKLATLRGGHTRLITTNFDLLFEDAAKVALKSRTRSNLPRIEYSDNDWGIVHLHGKVKQDYSSPDKDGFVLSSAEFGEAYLAHGWARNFVKDILDRYIAVFVGYSADDPPVRYLLEGLQRGNGLKHKLYAFQSGADSEAVAQWEDKGVEPIVYDLDEEGKYSRLWDSLALWAERAKDPAKWKKKVLKKAQRGPAKLLPHERGMVAHLVKSEAGAKAFAQENPPLSAEWLCVFDPSIRLKVVDKEAFQLSRTKDVNPYQLYSLDDDPAPSLENERYKQIPVKVWDAFRLDKKDFSAIEERNLSSLSGYYAVTPPNLIPRLAYLTSWIAKVLDQKITVWWAGKQGAFHPVLVNMLSTKLNMDQKPPLPKNVRSAWAALLDLNDYASRGKYDEYDFSNNVKSLGWSDALAREYVSISAPYLSQGSFNRAIPRNDRKKFNLRSLVSIDVKYPEGIYDVKIPNEYLEKVIRGLRFNLEKAVELEQSYSYWIEVCSIQPDEDVEGVSYSRSHDLSGYVLHFVKLYKNLMAFDLEAARREYRSWRKDPVFTRLRVWACGQNEIATEEEFLEEIISLEDDDFWPFRGNRDLLLSLKEKWNQLSADGRNLIVKKIKRGPRKKRGASKEEHQRYTATSVLERFYWLQGQGCDLNFDLNSMKDRLIKAAPDWKQEYAQNAAESHDGRSGWVRTDTDWSSLRDVTLSEIVSKTDKLRERDYRSFVTYDPFAGLCNDVPLKAIAAISLAMKSGLFPKRHWETLLAGDGRKNDSLRFKKLIGGRVSQIPDGEFKSILLTASRWFEVAGPSLREASPKLFSKIWDQFIRVIAENSELVGSALVRKENESIDWVMEAINSPVGNLTELHMTDPDKDSLGSGQGYPEQWIKRTNELLDLPGDSHRYAQVIFCYNLSWFYNIDPKWSSSRFVEILEKREADDLDKDAVWAGFMWGAKVPPADLYLRLKPLLLARVNENLQKRKRHTQVLSGLLLAGWGTKQGKEKRYVSNDEFRGAILNATEEFRGQVLWHLDQWSSDAEAEWNEKLIPFLRDVWPKHKKIRTAKTSARLCDLALSQEENFSEVSQLVVRLISKIGDEHVRLPEMRKSGTNIASKYPNEFLELLHVMLPERPERWPYGTKEALQVLELSSPPLLNDPRLIELKAKSNDL